MSEAVENRKVHAQQSEQKTWENSHRLVILPHTFGCDDMFMRHDWWKTSKKAVKFFG